MTQPTASADERKWWSKSILVGAVIALICLPLGALGYRFGVLSLMPSFSVISIGVILACIAGFLGLIAVVVGTMKGMTADRNTAAIGVVIAVFVLVPMGMQFSAAGSVPSIHNISTDTDDPPQFVAIVPIREAAGANPLEYNAAELAAPQREAYPWVKPLLSDKPPAEVFGLAVDVLRDMGMEIVAQDAANGIIEATATTFWFGFKDDVVVRIRGEASGSVIDVRSVSRVGQSDLGANAARIAQVLDGLR